MRVSYERGSIGISHEAANVEEAFRFLAAVQEIFRFTACGKCGGEIIYDFRRNRYEGPPDGYYEVHCLNENCRYRQRFPSRKPENGGGLFPSSEGWEPPYEKEQAAEPAPQAAPPSTAGEPAEPALPF